MRRHILLFEITVVVEIFSPALPDTSGAVSYTHLLYRELEDDLEKPEHQIWVVWGYESEVNYPWRCV